MVAPSCGDRIPVGVVGGRHGNAARFWMAGTVDAPAMGMVHASTAATAAKEAAGLNETMVVGLDGLLGEGMGDVTYALVLYIWCALN